MTFRKLNGVQHTDFKYTFLPQQPRNYFDSLHLFKQLAEMRNIEIILGGLLRSDGQIRFFILTRI